MSAELDQKEIEQLNACEGLLSFQPTWIYKKFYPV